jgi:hypothetical protein
LAVIPGKRDLHSREMEREAPARKSRFVQAKPCCVQNRK